MNYSTMTSGDLEHKFCCCFILAFFPVPVPSCAVPMPFLPRRHWFPTAEQPLLSLYLGLSWKVSLYWRCMVQWCDGHIRPPESCISKFKLSKPGMGTVQLTSLQHVYKDVQVYSWEFALQTGVYCLPIKDQNTGILPHNRSMWQGLK